MTKTKIAVGPRTSPRLLLLALLPVLALLAALAPATAIAQDGDGPCTAEVTATDEPTVANFAVDCGDGNEVENVMLDTSEGGSVEGDSDTRCNDIGSSSREFECHPEGAGSSVSGQFTNGQGDSVCTDPRLTIDFTVEFPEEGDEDQQIENVEVSGCEAARDDDSEDVPEGGVDSGAGGTAEASSSEPAVLPIAGAALIALALGAGGGLVLRRSRAAR